MAPTKTTTDNNNNNNNKTDKGVEKSASRPKAKDAVATSDAVVTKKSAKPAVAAAAAAASPAEKPAKKAAAPAAAAAAPAASSSSSKAAKKAAPAAAAAAPAATDAAAADGASSQAPIKPSASSRLIDVVEGMNAACVGLDDEIKAMVEQHLRPMRKMLDGLDLMKVPIGKATEHVQRVKAQFEALDGAAKTLLEDSRAVRKVREGVQAKSIAQAKKAEALRVVKALKKRERGVPDGLHAPALASPALNAFLGNPAGTMVRRVDAAKAVHAYMKAHGLKDNQPRGFGGVDAELAKFFPGEKSVEIFAIQRKLSSQFTKKADLEKIQAAAAAAAGK